MSLNLELVDVIEINLAENNSDSNDAQRYWFLKDFNELNGWTDEAIDREIARNKILGLWWEWKFVISKMIVLLTLMVIGIVHYVLNHHCQT